MFLCWKGSMKQLEMQDKVFQLSLQGEETLQGKRKPQSENQTGSQKFLQDQFGYQDRRN